MWALHAILLTIPRGGGYSGCSLQQLYAEITDIAKMPLWLELHWMLPPIDRRGLLPAGVHTATLAEVEHAFATNPTRQHRLAEFRRFIHEQLLTTALGLELYADGSYFTDKPVPGDIDCTVRVPVADVSRRLSLVNLVNDGRSPTHKGALWDNYHVDFHISLIGWPGANDFVDFFQYVGTKTASLKHLHEKERRGIVRVEQWELG